MFHFRAQRAVQTKPYTIAEYIYCFRRAAMDCFVGDSNKFDHKWKKLLRRSAVKRLNWLHSIILLSRKWMAS